jgi:sulfite exporter TauE/SafE
MPGIKTEGRRLPELRRLWEHGLSDHIIALAWSPDGKKLAAAVSGEIAIYSDNGAASPTLPGHDFGVTAIAWSADGQLLAGLVVTTLGFDLREEHLRLVEPLVAGMLVALGLNALRKVAGELWQTREIEKQIKEIITDHAGRLSTRKLPHKNPAVRSASLRPLIVGMIHGLAGSAALLLLLIPVIPSIWLKMAYLLVFGAGSITGMMLMSWLVGLPAHLTAARFARVHFGVRALAGLFGVLFGLRLLCEFVTD